jgi:hypothetical protein
VKLGRQQAAWEKRKVNEVSHLLALFPNRAASAWRSSQLMCYAVLAGFSELWPYRGGWFGCLPAGACLCAESPAVSSTQ